VTGCQPEEKAKILGDCFAFSFFGSRKKGREFRLKAARSANRITSLNRVYSIYLILIERGGDKFLQIRDKQRKNQSSPRR